MNTNVKIPGVNRPTTTDFDDGEMGYPIRPPFHRIILDLLFFPTFRIPKSTSKVRVYNPLSAHDVTE